MLNVMSDSAGYSSTGYDPSDFPPFAVTVDIVILTVRGSQLEVLLVQRDAEPFAGCWALPGGFVGPDQDLLDAAAFKLGDKTGIGIDRSHLEQLATFGAPDRDPRMRIVSVSHLALVPMPSAVESAGQRTAWVSVDVLGGMQLAFDHPEIIRVGVERARSKLEYTTLATAFCEPDFTIAELRQVYETVWGESLDPPNFHRKVLATAGFVEDTGESKAQAKGRPAKLYRAGEAMQLSPPLQRSS